jgi:imidazolonepropionase-like amidohydrolase
MNTRIKLSLYWVVPMLFLTAHPVWAQKYAIRNVTLVSMEDEKPIENQTVLIENGIIAEINNTKRVKPGKDFEVVDGTGKYLIPGLFDMHAHFYYEHGQPNTCETELKLMLANGLTTVRIIGGHPEYLEARKKVRTQEWLGPQVLVASLPFAGQTNNPDNPFEYYCTNKEDAKKGVKRFKDEGYDAIKLTFMVTPDVYDAVIETAKEVGIKVTGHVGPLVTLPRALKAGQQIEHMDEFIDQLLPDKSVNNGQSVSDMNLWRPQAWSTVPHLDESRISGLVKDVKEAGVYVTPTNYFFHSFFGVGIDEAAAKENVSYPYIPATIKTFAWKVRERYLSQSAPMEYRQKYVNLRKKMVYELWKAGVPLMAGSDSPQWFGVTGFAIHEELENLVLCGLTPYAALQTATINPAKYLELDHKKGSITKGKVADLLLLDKNPLEDIRHTRNIHSVFSGTRYLSAAEISNLLEETRKLSN